MAQEPQIENTIYLVWKVLLGNIKDMYTFVLIESFTNSNRRACKEQAYKVRHALRVSGVSASTMKQKMCLDPFHMKETDTLGSKRICLLVQS